MQPVRPCIQAHAGHFEFETPGLEKLFYEILFQAVLGFYGMSEIGSIARSFSPTSLGIVTPGVNFIKILRRLLDDILVQKIRKPK